MRVGDGAGGRFELEPDELAARLADWEDLRADLEADRAHGSRLLHTTSAGDEPASKTMANLIHRSGDEFLKHNTTLIAYVDDYIAAFKGALADYVSGEDAAVQAMRGQIR